MDTGIKGRSVQLVPMTPEHLPWLFRWYNDVESRALWSGSAEVLDATAFMNEWDRRMRQRIHVIFIIHPLPFEGQQTCPIGFCYDYDYSSTDGHTYLCTFLAGDVRGRGKGAEATYLFIDYLFAQFPLHKLYSDIFEHNRPSLSVTRHGGFVQEGHFGKHRFCDGDYHAQLRFALYREEWDKAKRRYQRLFIAKPQRTTEGITQNV